MPSRPVIGTDARAEPSVLEDRGTAPVGRTFALTLGAVAVATAGVQIATLPLPDPGRLAQWVALGIVAAMIRLPLTSERGAARAWLLHPVALATGAALGPVAGLLVAGLGALAAGWAGVVRCWRRAIAGAAAAVLGATAAGGIMAATVVRPDRHPLDAVQAAGVAATAYFLVETGLWALGTTMAARGGLARTWLAHGLPTAPGYVAGAAVAAIVGAGERAAAWGGFAVAPTLLLAAWAHRHLAIRLEEERRRVRELSEIQLATVEALALAIEVQDRTGHAQMRRMQVYAEGLARAAGMREEDIAGVKTAALLLDIGNLAVPGHILDKPGALSAEEFERIKIHPRVGADLVEHIPFPYPVAHLILSHHERWDGRGYPAGHAGTAIPIGARVLAVVDTFTTLLFDRPYRRAHSFSEAVATLREEAGRALDPDLVERFIEVLPALEVRLQAAPGSWPMGGTKAAGAGIPVTARAFDDIAGAHREVQVLYEIAQALGSSLAVEDTVTLVASRLHRLVPFACCALFLRTEQARLACRHVVGSAPAGLREVEAASVEWLASRLSEVAAGSSEALRSVLVARLEVGSAPLGALAVGHGTAGLYTGEHRRILDLVARQVAPVIQNSLAFEATQRASLTDPLTGLANRRALVGHVTREVARAGRHGDQVTLLLLDLDNLKRLNDTYGHQAGDRTIREVADTIRALLRAYDLCARYAGDEFVVVLAGCDATEADERRAELQRAVDGLRVDVGRGRLATVGISAGAATFPADGHTIDELLAVADQRMYEDKVRRQAQPLLGREGPRRQVSSKRAAS